MRRSFVLILRYCMLDYSCKQYGEMLGKEGIKRLIETIDSITNDFCCNQWVLPIVSRSFPDE